MRSLSFWISFAILRVRRERFCYVVTVRIVTEPSQTRRSRLLSSMVLISSLPLLTS